MKRYFWLLFFVVGCSSPLSAVPFIQLRYFPELDTVTIRRVIYENATTIFLWADEGFYRWTGRGWERLRIPLGKEIKVQEIHPYDAQRFVITYSPQEHYYHSKIIFFDGKRWRSIPAKQPYKITKVTFQDSVRFFAVDILGSAIYYDGDSTRLLPGYPRLYFTDLWVLPNQTLYAMGSLEKVGKNDMVLLKYQSGAWKKILDLPGRGIVGKVWHPDSGLFLFSDGSVFSLNRGRFRLLRKIQVQSVGNYYPFYLDSAHQYYFWEKGAFWRMDFNGEIQKVFDFNFPAKVFPLKKGYLILYKNQIFYVGSEAIGTKLPRVKPFFYSVILGKNRSLGASLYQGKDNVWVYWTIPDRINRFLELVFEPGSGNQTTLISRENRIFSTGLLEYEYQKGIFDGGTGFADLDNDGDQDAVLFSLNGRTLLFENIGDDRFRNITIESGIDVVGRISTMSFVDWDFDGDLDLILGNEIGSLKFIRNKGYLRFEDVSSSIAVTDSFPYYLPALADVDQDGDADLFLYSVFGPLHYFENAGLDAQHLPIFIERSARSPQMTRNPYFFTQSLSFADYDNDGDLDVLLVNRQHSLKLFENTGRLTFREVTLPKGLNRVFLSYGASWGDLDCDGDLDFVLGTLGKNYIFWNTGNTFVIDSTILVGNNLTYTTGTIVEDLDRDGDLDILFANYLIGSDVVYLNRLDHPSFIVIQVRGRMQCNRDGVGSMIWLYERSAAGDTSRLAGMQYLQVETGYGGFKFPVAYFGVDPDKRYDAKIQFPGGKRVQVYNLQPGKRYLIQEPVGLQWVLYEATGAAKGWFLKKSKRIQLSKFFLFILIFLGFNLMIRYGSFWPVIQVLFFNTILFSFYIILEILLFVINPSMNWIVPFYLLVFAGGFTFYVIDKYTEYKFGMEFRYELFDLFRQFQHSKNGLAQIEHLIFFCSNIKGKENPELFREFLKELHYFRTFTLPFIYSVLGMSARLKQTRPKSRQAQKLLKIIERSLDSLYSGSKVTPKCLKNLKELLLRLKNELVTLRRQTERAVSCDGTEVIARTLRHYREFTEVKFHRTPGEKVPLVVVPGEVLSRILGEMFQNALEAMDHLEQKKLDVSVRCTTTGVEIRIRDYGKGIPAEIQDKIFEEQFSTKNSTGLGLYHARKLLRKYGGEIRLLQSNRNKGSLFGIYLKGVDHA